MRVKFNEIKQGKTFWQVRALYSAEGKPHLSVVKMFVLGRPYLNKSVDDYFFRCIETHYFGTLTGAASVQDLNVIQNTYNMHALFSSKKSAERYAARLKSDCLSDRERAIKDKLTNTPKETYSRSLDWYDFYGSNVYAADKLGKSNVLLGSVSGVA